jgi:hypothetical protein
LKVARGKQVVFSPPKSLTSDECILVSTKIGAHVEFSLRTAETSLNKASEQSERICAGYREGPRRLTLKEHHALAGVLYRDLATGIFEDDPVSEDWWRIVHELIQYVITAPTLTIDAQEGRLRRLDKFVGPFIEPFLCREGIVPANEDRHPLLRAFAGVPMLQRS